MAENEQKTKSGEEEVAGSGPSEEENFGNTTTVELSREVFAGSVPAAQRAYFEIVGPHGKGKIVELGTEDIILGRSPECQVRLTPKNVSRNHARVFFRNEEYHIEDLNSTNGVYVNGIKVEKCVLRDNDQIEIGGVKILFNEERTLQKNETSK